ncbi:MAG TPA: UDP-N-acetylmuramoyl-L-alanine--D-glutamate ligase [Verrucomicrobiae bacterium]|nr:UDP-N-acetylmuramoyl-L-alanine--D-glutamate ligase [Verrucomicrobiae bacterium]
MIDLKDKDVLVIGLGRRGQAACELLRRQGARVMAVDPANTPALQEQAAALRPMGIEVALGASDLPKKTYSLAVVTPAVLPGERLLRAVSERNVPLVGELELGFQHAKCLAIGITGTNGKSTTAGLIEQLLLSNNRKTVLSGDPVRPVCSIADQTRELDFLLLQVSASQLEHIEFFRPAVAVLLNIAPDHSDRYPTAEEYIRASGEIFKNQQAFDWAIIQSEALSRLRELKVPIPGKIISFSASDPEADLHLDRGLIISRVGNWAGPLIDMDECRLRGPHNAENIMAALAVGHVLRLPIETMRDPIKTREAGPHRFQFVEEINGVQFIDDSKAANLDALRKALLAARPAPQNQPNIWLIAGGQEKNFEFHDLGPLLSRRVRKAFLLGEASEKLRAAWSLFTPCKVSGSLVEAVVEAAQNADPGDVVLFSPACSSFDQFLKSQNRGDEFCAAVKSISRGAEPGSPYGMGKSPEN